MKEIKAVFRRILLDKVIDQLHELPHLPGITMSMVHGYLRNDPHGRPSDLDEETVLAKIEIVVPDELVETVVEIIAGAAHTGRSGDGKIFIYDVADVVRISSGERGAAAI